MSAVFRTSLLLFACSLFGNGVLLGKSAAWEVAVDTSEALQQAGNPQQAEQVLLQVLQNEERLESHHLAYIHNNLGSICQDERRLLDADRYYRRSITEWEKAGDMHRMALAITLNNLASLLWDTGKLTEAERVFIRSANIQIDIVGVNHPTAANLFYNLGAVHSTQKRWGEAEAAYRQALILFSQSPGNQPRAALTMINLALVYRRTGRNEEADPLFDRARSLWQRGLSSADATPILLLDLATALWSGHQLTDAESVVKEALALAESRFGATHPRTAQALSLYAEILGRTHRKAQAKVMRRRADEIAIRGSQVGLSRQTIDVSDLVHRRHR
jgi:tetratricopeptide (TPR) repeat protein